MRISSLGAGALFTMGGGNVGLTTGLIFHSLETLWLFVGPHILLGLQITNYACGYSISRADILPKEPEAYNGGGHWYDLTLFRMIVLELKTLSEMY